MKKYLLIFMGVLSLFFFSDSASALSFNAPNGNEYTVDSEFNLALYCYSKMLENNYNTFAVGRVKVNSGNYYCIYGNNTYYFLGSTNERISFYDSFTKNNFVYITRDAFTAGFDFVDSQQLSSTYFRTIIYSNVDIYSSDTNSVYFSKNVNDETFKDYIDVIPKYNLTFYINNEIYKQVEVEEGSSFDISEISYIPPKNYNFNGWNLENVDLTNITSDLNIYGTTTYIRPDMNYSENIDSLIHEISISIIGKNVPVEFDYIYTVMDFIILLVLVFCVVMPFVIIIKLLEGRW